MLAAVIYFHSGKNTPVNAEDKFWTFVTRKEMRTLPGTDTANGRMTIIKERIETETFNYVRKIIAAAIVIENPLVFYSGLPPETASASRSDADFEQSKMRDIRILSFFKIAAEPKSDIPEDTRIKVINPKAFEALFPNPDAELKAAPAWLKKMIVNITVLQMNVKVPELLSRIMKYQYRNQTVYHFDSINSDPTEAKFSFVYDADGKIICQKAFFEDDTSQNCADFGAARKDGKFVWKDMRRWTVK